MAEHMLPAQDFSDTERALSARVAVVDDDVTNLENVALILETAGYTVDRYLDGRSALEGIHLCPPHLALVDLVMPQIDGMELMRQLRRKWIFPIIMLTARDDEVDEVLCLRLGADDFIRKPFSQRLLTERVRASLRRSHLTAAHQVDRTVPDAISVSSQIMRRGPLEMDADRHLARWHGKDVSLTVTEFNLLQALAKNPGYVKSRDQLMDVAYDEQVYVDDRTIDSHIKRLRKKLRAIDPEFAAIETLYGVGYKYMPTDVSGV
ncbi:MAG: response regulator transcription factor [Pseudomonadota bacterium]